MHLLFLVYRAEEACKHVDELTQQPEARSHENRRWTKNATEIRASSDSLRRKTLSPSEGESEGEMPYATSA